MCSMPTSVEFIGGLVGCVGLLEQGIRSILVSFSVAVKKFSSKSNFNEKSLSSSGFHALIPCGTEVIGEVL